jgi:hypothetical protein
MKWDGETGVVDDTVVPDSTKEVDRRGNSGSRHWM